MADELAAVVMAAGIGTRMRSATPKHLHPILGRRMVDWVVEAGTKDSPMRCIANKAPTRAVGRAITSVRIVESKKTSTIA